MNDKTKVISVRVPNEVAEILEMTCSKEGVSKSDVLSELIVGNYNMKVKKDAITPLEKLLFKLRMIVPHDYHQYAKVETPAIIMGTKDDGEWEGKPIILVGDDTIIREKDGMFDSWDMHHENEEPLWLTEQDILDYYEGMEEAYGLPNTKRNSYHFLRGFMQVANNLLPDVDYYLIYKKERPLHG